MSKLRIAIAGFNLESVTFLPDPTTLAEFERLADRGEGLLTAYRGTNTVPGGLIAACDAAGAEIAPLVYSEAGAAASATEEAFDAFLAEIADGAKALLGEIDGLLLGLHGALVTTGGRTDLDFLCGVRASVGPALPIGVAFDLHGNLDPKLVEHATIMSGYHESPHIDMGETGERVGRLLLGHLRGEIKPHTRLDKVPITLPSIFTATRLAPLSDIMAAARAEEAAHPKLLDLSVLPGFAYADVAQIGFSIIATTDNDPTLAQQVTGRMASRIWDLREKLFKRDEVFTVADGLDRAASLVAEGQRPVVILEHADRMNDSTYVLREALTRGMQRVAIPYLYDPIAARTAMAAGAGAKITLPVGGHTSDKAGGPVELSGTVLWAGEKRYTTTGEMGHGRAVDLGPTAVVRSGGVTVWIVSANKSAIDLDPFIQFDLPLEGFDIVVLRSKTHFRAVWGPASSKIIIVDTPDWGPALLETLPYKHARAGVFPIT